MSEPVTRTLTIVNGKGLHARASAKLVELVEEYDAEAVVSKDGVAASADSIMGLLMLVAAKGSTITVTTTGALAEDLGAAIEELVADKFGEEA